MYTQFFGFHRRPFVLSPDPEFLFVSKGHDLALTHLEYGLMQNVGFVALTGEVGAGKTTLLKFIFEKVKKTLDIAMIFNTHLDSQGLLEMLVREFELQPSTGSKTVLVDTLFQHFVKQYSLGNRCVIVVDEAQNLPQETFEELRMLSNLEAGSDFLVQIVLVGQPQLRERLAQPSLAQLTQRISVHYHLQPLGREEVAEYIQHRLKVAGYSAPDSLFSEEAVTQIGEVSRGTPRLINTLCDASLTYAFADGLNEISREVVDKVVADNELLLIGFGNNGTGDGGQSPGYASAVQQFDGSGPGGASLDAAAASLLFQVLNRMEAMEARVKAVESGQNDKAVEVLREMLAREREQNLQQAQKVAFMSRRYRELQDELTELKRRNEEQKTEANSRKTWRLFGGRAH